MPLRIREEIQTVPWAVKLKGAFRKARESIQSPDQADGGRTWPLVSAGTLLEILIVAEDIILVF